MLCKLPINEIFCIDRGCYPQSCQNLLCILEALGWQYSYLEDHYIRMHRMIPETCVGGVVMFVIPET